MRINFVGNFQSGYVGEVADETHLCDELEYLGHQVKRVPRDIWKGYVDGANDWPEVTDQMYADINIICKWVHFNTPDYIQILKHKSKAPVFYWVWDYMQGEPEHMTMVKEADLYIANDIYSGQYKNMNNIYYFPFDVADASIDKVEALKKYDVAFFGSYLDQGDRIHWLPEINKVHKVKVFSWNWEEWKSRGFDAEPAVYGQEFAQKVAESKIILGFNVNDHSWGYWSNRTGKVLCAGGFLLYRWVPGMELFLRDGAVYFSSPQEAIKKINYYLDHASKRRAIANRGYEIGRGRFTSRERVKDLTILMDRFLRGGFNGSK